ncbi:MAG TPA: hypothetical protein VFV79_04140, partial [Saprospiraceae bacterium]|nr:hypothetical protein [Saprospiraceae bacterium]
MGTTSLPPALNRELRFGFSFGEPHIGGRGQAWALFLLFPFLFIAKSFSQGVNLGVPPIWNFSKKIYKASTQNWDANQDSNGRVYFAN